MKIHWLSVIRYCLMLLLIIFFILIFKQNYLVFLLIPYVLLPVISIPLFIINSRKVSFEIVSPVDYIDDIRVWPVSLKYNNPTIYPFLKCSLFFDIGNHYMKKNGNHRLNFSVMPKRKDWVLIEVEVREAGMISFESTGMKVTEMMGILSLKAEPPKTLSIPAFPKAQAVSEIPEMPYSEGYEEYTEPDNKGMISSDVKEIREYRPGDRLARIHWKVSAKLDELCVKEMERTSVMSVVVLPELERTKILKTIETLEGLTRQLLAREERFEICLYNIHSCDFEYFLIDSREALWECYRVLFVLPVYESAELALDAYFSSMQKSAFLISVSDEDISLYEDGIKL